MRRTVLVLALGLLSSWAASAQIVIGQTAAFTGPGAASVKEMTDGAKLYFEQVNAAGGVFGEKIELVSLDDQGNPQKAAANAKKLIGENALALMLTHGVAPTQAVVPVAVQAQVPLVAPSSGALALRQPANPWVFNLRASSQAEAEHAVDHLVQMGMSRIGLAYSNDAYGMDARIGALRGFDKAHMRVAFALPYNPLHHADFSQVVLGVSKLDAQAVILIGPGRAVADATRALRLKGLPATVVTLSNNANGHFVKQMAEFARGALVAQAFPDEHAMSAPLIKEAYSLANAKGIYDLTPDMVEGFASAKLMVEGLKKAGKQPTRQKLHDALDSLGKINLGGMEVVLSPKNHAGADFTDLAIIGPDGKFRR